MKSSHFLRRGARELNASVTAPTASVHSFLWSGYDPGKTDDEGEGKKSVGVLVKEIGVVRNLFITAHFLRTFNLSSDGVLRLSPY
ncbi:unnamed protein product [Enterobius vermicularis]|uniref:Uncharacterized protein n=1 Tax=Enterobius vermicularis TaxID=51028 RepID=A0A0N4V313_ENTVE|nr:unnamed protein product [Enterobius vermicularis]